MKDPWRQREVLEAVVAVTAAPPLGSSPVTFHSLEWPLWPSARSAKPRSGGREVLMLILLAL